MFEVEVPCADGARRSFITHKASYQDAAGHAAGIVGVMADISERQRAEEERKRIEVQLRHSQKLQAIGQLAAGIAHEINTPTQYVGDNIRFLQNSFADLSGLLRRYGQLYEAVRAGAVTPDLLVGIERAQQAADVDYLNEEIPKAIGQSLEGVGRVSKIVRAMKEFSHPDAAEKTPTDLNHAIETTLTVARNEWKYVADAVTDFDPALPAVPCLPGEFNQVMLNLIINAAHAIADVVGDGSRGKGTITVRTRRDGEWAEIQVSDTGTGIPERVRSRIFDPFFTTKAVGKGTGQGLAIAHAVVVEKHRGAITFETQEGSGTTFTVRLPLQNASGPLEQASSDRHCPAGPPPQTGTNPQPGHPKLTLDACPRSA